MLSIKSTNFTYPNRYSTMKVAYNSSPLSSSSEPEQHKSLSRVHFLFFPWPLWLKEVQKVPAALQEQWAIVDQSPVQLHVVPRASSLQASCTDKLFLNPSTSGFKHFYCRGSCLISWMRWSNELWWNIWWLIHAIIALRNDLHSNRNRSIRLYRDAL